MKQFLLCLLATCSLTAAAQQMTLRQAQPKMAAQKLQPKQFTLDGASLNGVKPTLKAGECVANTPARTAREGAVRDPQQISWSAEPSPQIDSYSADLTLSKLQGKVMGNAQQFPASLLQRYAGATLSTIECRVPAQVTSMSEVTVFIWDYETGDQLWTSSTSPTFKPGVNTVPCDYVITGDKTLFVGFYGSAKGTEYTVDVYETDGTPDGYIIANKNFYNYGNVFSQGGETLAAPIFCYATGGKGGLKDYDVQLIDSDGIRSEGSADDVVPTNATIINWGIQPVQSMDYSFAIDGQTYASSLSTGSAEKVFPYGATVYFNYEGHLAATPGRSVATLSVDKVNGQPDQFTEDGDNAGGVPVITLPAGSPKRKILLEMPQSTVDGFTVFSLVAQDNLRELLPEVNTIGMHFTPSDSEVADELADPTVPEVLPYVLGQGFTMTAGLNREQLGYDLYYGDATEEVTLEEGLIASLRNYLDTHKCEARCTQLSSTVNGTQVNVTSEFNFVLPASEGSYAVIYNVSEDGPKGTQANVFAGMSTAKIPWAEFHAFCNLGKTYTATYKDVSRAYSDPFGLNDGSALGAVEAGQTLKHSASFNVAMLDNAEKASVTAMLIDLQTGVVVQSQRAALGTTFTGIAAVEVGQAPQVDFKQGAFTVRADKARAQVYSTDGRLISSCTVNGEASLPVFTRGAYILRVETDGQVSTTKVVY